uniref:Uncharacterized protein n=1 Tax=Arundo donax TaxID=35708 RepID=A0A0A9CEV3_ARUDO
MMIFNALDWAYYLSLSRFVVSTKHKCYDY